MKIKQFYHHHHQMSQLGCHHWSVARLIEMSKDLKVMDIPLDHLCISYRYNKLTIKDMVMHMRAVHDADLACPIILDEEGDIMDGRHRVIKAIMENKKTIKAVRFEENPKPCRIDDD